MRDAGALANALDDVGTKVNDEIAFVRMLADLDLDHIRVLKIMIRRPKHLDRVAVQAVFLSDGGNLRRHGAEMSLFRMEG